MRVYIKRWEMLGIFFFSLAFVIACSRPVAGSYEGMVPRCDDYLVYVQDSVKNKQLVRWADKAFFSRSFGRDSFRTGWFSGPGLANDTIDLEHSRIDSPDWFSGYPYEVRLVAKDRREFDVIFIGGGKYCGLLVVRDGWEGKDRNIFLKDVELEMVNGRVGVLCYSGPK